MSGTMKHVPSLRLFATTAIFGVVLVGCAGATADVPESLQERAKRLDAIVWQVATGGLWEDGESYGKCRVVVLAGGAEHVRTFVYAQWLRLDEASKALVEYDTRDIPDFNSDLSKSVRSVTVDEKPTTGGVRFILVVHDQEKNQQDRVALVLKKPGVFQVDKLK